MKIQLISIALICSLCLPNTAWASSVGTAAVRGAEKSLARGLRRPANRLLAFDALRDRKSHLSILRGQRSVDRYTSARTAGSEQAWHPGEPSYDQFFLLQTLDCRQRQNQIRSGKAT